MLDCDAKEYFHDYDELRIRGHAVMIDDVDVMIGTQARSKREHKRLFADCSDGFCFNVPYSLNKKGRWKKVNGSSLLNTQPTCSSDIHVVHKEMTPLRFYEDLHGPTVSHVQVRNDDDTAKNSENMKTLGPSKRDYVKHSNDGQHQVGQAAVEAAEIHLNTIKPPRLTSYKANRWRIVNSSKNNVFGTRSRVHVDMSEIADYGYEDLEDDFQCSAEDLPCPERSEFQQTQRDIKLGDFLLHEQPSPSTKRVKKSTDESELASSFEAISVKPPSLIDISAATNTTHIFEIIDVNFDKLEKFDLREEITLVVPQYFTVRWFGGKRVDHRDSEFDCRDSEDKKLFLPEYNCKEFTDVAIRACEHDMLAFIERHYKIDDFEVFCGTEVETAVCCECNSLYNTDLFPTVYGTMCRQCVASYVVRQLRLSRFPLRIPLLSSSGSSPIDLLYAILPQSVVSLIIKKSYAHFYTVDHPEAVFTQCPRCSTPFVLPQRSEFSICTCSICGCFWCYFCNREPH
ncbi:hypothetical protein Aduo_008088 [Ancylostoma duodenale]